VLQCWFLSGRLSPVHHLRPAAWVAQTNCNTQQHMCDMLRTSVKLHCDICLGSDLGVCAQ
jgi:hypothetical protein